MRRKLSKMQRWYHTAKEYEIIAVIAAFRSEGDWDSYKTPAQPWFHHHLISNSSPEMQLLIHLTKDQRRFVGQFQFHASPANGVWSSPCPVCQKWELVPFMKLLRWHLPSRVLLASQQLLTRNPICHSECCTWLDSSLNPWSSTSEQEYLCLGCQHTEFLLEVRTFENGQFNQNGRKSSIQFNLKFNSTLSHPSSFASCAYAFAPTVSKTDPEVMYCLVHSVSSKRGSIRFVAFLNFV